MKRNSFVRIIAMMLVLCMLLASCGGNKSNDDTPVQPTVTTPGCQHPSTATVNAKSADCTTDGYTGDQVCTACYTVVTPGSSIPATGHVRTKVTGAKPATCTATGYTGDKVCTTCGTKVENGSEIAITAHNYDSGMTTKVPTCMSTGVKTFTCGGCGISYTEELDVVAHYDEYHDMLDGTHNHTCATCTMNNNEAHTPVDAGRYVEATCEERAYTELTCSVCKGVYKEYDESSAPTGHSYGKWSVVDATCIKDGYKVHTCSACDKVETVTISATPDVHNHEFARYEGEAPSCGEGAVEVYVCVDCGVDSYTKNVPATGAHDFDEPVSSDDGWVRKTCLGCGYVVSSFDASKLKEEGVSTDSIPDDVPLSVTNDTATLEFPTSVIEQLKGGDNVKIDAGILTDEAKNAAIENATNLTDEEKERLAGVEIYDFNVKIDDVDLAGNFADGVIVTIPYTLKYYTDENGNEVLEDKDGIIIWYVSADGTITKIDENVVYNAENGTVTFLAPHFSMYAVAYEETQEMKCRRGYHAYEVISTVAASCSGFGFSTLQCTWCHRITVDYIVEKLFHTYGEIIKAQPTCDSGDYDHKICKDCGDVLNIRYYRELGHQIDSVATCTTGSYCSRCDKVAVAPLGHSWSEWKVVVHAGPLTNGLRVRYCLRCGEAQESQTASTGDITALKFESHEELLEAIYDLVVSVDKARVEFSLEVYNYGLVEISATVDKSGDDMLVFVEISKDGENEGYAYYKNGVIILEHGGEYGNINIDSAILVPIDISAKYMQAYYDLLNPYFEMGISSLREELTAYIDILGEDINEILFNAGINYTAESLLSLLDSIETVYAYASLKLGYTTGAEIKDGVPVPTKADFVGILKAFMDSTTDGRYTTYTADVNGFIESVYSVLDWLVESCEKTVSEVVFEKLGDRLAQLDPTIQDAATLAAYLKTQLPGTLKVEEALVRVENVLSEFSSMTLDDLYGLINELAGSAYGEEFDVEAMLSEYYSLTLNDLVTGMVGEEITAEQFFDAIIGQMDQMLFGKIYFQGAEIADIVGMIHQRLDAMLVDVDFSFTVDMYGQLVEVNVGESLKTEFADENGDMTEVLINSFSFKIVRDDSIKITIPEVLKPADTVVKGYIDAEGNYVITGLPEGATIENAELIGNYYADLEDILVLDTEVSADLGFNVYATPKYLWNRLEGVENLIKLNGKYYNYSVTETRGEYPELGKYVGAMDLFEFLDNPSAILPDGNDAPVASYNGTPVYTSPIGYLMQIEGDWWVCEAYLYYTYDKNANGIYNERYSIEHMEPRYKFSEMFAGGVELSSVEDYYYNLDYWYYGVNFNVRIDLYLGGSTYEFRGVSDSDGIKLVYVPDGSIEEKYYQVYNIGAERKLSQYQYDGMGNYTEQGIVQINGQRVETTVEIVHLYKDIPEYYIKVADGVYLRLNSKYSVNIGGNFGYVTDGFSYIPNSGIMTSSYLYTNVNVSGLETKALSDGNTMYVVGRVDPYVCGYTYGEVYYGYVKVLNNGYLRAYCLEQDGHVVEVVYEGCSSTVHVEYDDVYSLKDYMSFENGVLTVSKELVSELLEECTNISESVMINLTASKVVNARTYHYMFRGYVEFVPEEDITLSGPSISTPQVNIFAQLFSGHSGGDKLELITYVNEDGDLVIEGADILDIYGGFAGSFPADPFLEYDENMSEQTGLDIYSYQYVTKYGTDYIYMDGKYYHYDWEHNYAVQSMSLNEIIGNWRVADMRYRFTIYPHEDTPEELHNKMVYDIRLAFLGDDKGFFNESNVFITLYGFVKDGELQILTGAVPSGESLVTFEGYKPIDEYITSLSATVDYTHEHYFVIEGVPGTRVEYCEIILTEPVYSTYYRISLYRMPDGKYIYRSSVIDEYLYIREEAVILGNCTLDRVYQQTYTNGVYEKASFTWQNVYTYYAVKIGDIFYDYNDYLNNHYWQISDLEEFRNQMYDTDRVYRVWDDELQDYRYYNKFKPGQYFEGEDELVGFVIPTDNYSVSHLGTTENGYSLEEIVYYLDESIDPEIETVRLADGRLFYHINGIGYVKLGENHYVKAVMAYDNNGDAYAICLYRRAYIYEHELFERGFIDEYFNRQKDSVTIPKEMLEYMSRLPDHCYFSISTSVTDLRFDYYILEAYFRGEIGGSIGGDYGDKGKDDMGYGK